MRGGAGRDLVSGGDGDDFLTGNAGDDRLRGGADDDVLRGGGDGDDVLYGGAGVDALSGDEGFDTFVFNAVNASPFGSTSDSILDFEIGSDAIDLSGLANGQMEISILGAFTGTGPSVRTAEAGGDTRVFVDADGNGTADMRIIVAGVVGLTVADFVL